MTRYSTQNIDEDDIQAVVSTLRSDFLTQGPCIEKFEQAICTYTGASYASVMSSATAALHIGCLALGVDQNSLVWTSPNSFAASSNCALYCGAKVDFVDIDLETYNISIEKLEEKLQRAKKDNALPDVLIPVHFAGQSCEMSKIFELGKTYGFKIIEDASHALGATFAGHAVGDCAYSDLTVFSFHPVKMITTGEGGALVTQNKDLYKKSQALRSHGIVPASNGVAWESEQCWLGYNYRITEIQAALGVSQLKKLDRFVEKRRNLAARYPSLIGDLPLILPKEKAQSRMSYHLYVVRLENKSHREQKVRLFNQLKGERIGCQVHYRPIYHHPYYQSLGFQKGYCKNAETYYKQALSIPLHTKMTEADQDHVAEIFHRLLA